MHEDIRNYFDNKVNNQKLEDEITELNKRLEDEIAESNKKVLDLGLELEDLQLKLNKSIVKGEKKNTTISNLKRKVRRLTRQKKPHRLE